MIVRGIGLASQPPHHPGMDRRRFLLTSLAGAVAAPLGAEAQQAGRIVRVGILAAGSTNEAPNAAFFDRMRELGYIEGRTVRSRMAPAPSEPEPWTGQDKTAVAP